MASTDFMDSDRTIAVIRYPSLVQWLADRLVRVELENIAIAGSDAIPLPLFSQSDRQFGTFASPFPLQWSKRGDHSAQTIGAAIVRSLTCQTRDSDFAPALWMHPEGWLYVSFGPQDLAKWLQTLVGAAPELWLPARAEEGSRKMESGISRDPVLFELQYAHARCCSLLRLARQEKCLPLDDIGDLGDPSCWQTPTGELLLQAKPEQALLRALMQFPQSLSPQKAIYGNRLLKVLGSETRLEWSLPQKHLRKQAWVWSQLFCDFYRECRLFGDVRETSPALARSRFALIAIVRKVLAFVLEDVLQLDAPAEL
ncbi:hypothetical protein [Altericista sp. CCNU0014]|uniref:hypothetical protein n=1 Tax=Altericista sp. CCNU0014 TaxID=3082949 RepID=UPI00384C52A1